MSTTWGEQFVDRSVERAWLDFRLDLADRFVAGLESSEMDPVDFTSPTGVSLTVGIEDAHVVVRMGSLFHATDNVDEAAHYLVEILRERWEIVHPIFLDSPVVDVPSIPDEQHVVTVPTLGRAASREQLQSWVEATFREWISGQIKVNPNGAMPWRTRGGGRVLVTVRNAGRIEFLAVLGRRVGFKKAHKVIDELSRKWFGLKFYLIQDTLVMTQTVVAYPFVADQLTGALRTFMTNTDQLGWVAEKVISKRAKADRTALEALKKGHEEAQKALVEASEELHARAEELEVVHDDYDAVVEALEAARTQLARVRRERDAAQAKLQGAATWLSVDAPTSRRSSQPEDGRSRQRGSGRPAPPETAA